MNWFYEPSGPLAIRLGGAILRGPVYHAGWFWSGTVLVLVLILLSGFWGRRPGGERRSV